VRLDVGLLRVAGTALGGPNVAEPLAQPTLGVRELPANMRGGQGLEVLAALLVVGRGHRGEHPGVDVAVDDVDAERHAGRQHVHVGVRAEPDGRVAQQVDGGGVLARLAEVEHPGVLGGGELDQAQAEVGRELAEVAHVGAFDVEAVKLAAGKAGAKDDRVELVRGGGGDDPGRHAAQGRGEGGHGCPPLFSLG
jgi:hypothetical protein